MFIALLPIDLFTRNQAENIENCSLSNDNVQKIIEKVILLEITDFMDLCNNQEIDLNNYWVSYLNKTLI